MLKLLQAEPGNTPSDPLQHDHLLKDYTNATAAQFGSPSQAEVGKGTLEF